uniref:Akirin-2 n=1 Tax=Sus scrofa TaxID=9823 RepID=A0A8D1GEI9_PIG
MDAGRGGHGGPWLFFPPFSGCTKRRCQVSGLITSSLNLNVIFRFHIRHLQQLGSIISGKLQVVISSTVLQVWSPDQKHQHLLDNLEMQMSGPTPHLYNIKQHMHNIKQECKCMQKKRHLETSFQLSDPCCTSEAQPHAVLLSGPASPGVPSATSSPLKKEQPLFTLQQVGMICEHLLKEREEKVREKYEEILNTKRAEQYDAFVKFTHDQIL